MAFVQRFLFFCESAADLSGFVAETGRAANKLSRVEACPTLPLEGIFPAGLLRNR
jgi:hypothetical protein